MLSYAIAFSMKAPFARMLEQMIDNEDKMAGLFSLNDSERHACKLSGFLPLHVCIANGLTHMYDFLLDFKGLPLETQIKLHPFRADPNALSARGEHHITTPSVVSAPARSEGRPAVAPRMLPRHS